MVQRENSNYLFNINKSETDSGGETNGSKDEIKENGQKEKSYL